MVNKIYTDQIYRKGIKDKKPEGFKKCFCVNFGREKATKKRENSKEETKTQRHGSIFFFAFFFYLYSLPAIKISRQRKKKKSIRKICSYIDMRIYVYIFFLRKGKRSEERKKGGLKEEKKNGKTTFQWH